MLPYFFIITINIIYFLLGSNTSLPTPSQDLTRIFDVSGQNPGADLGIMIHYYKKLFCCRSWNNDMLL